MRGHVFIFFPGAAVEATEGGEKRVITFAGLGLGGFHGDNKNRFPFIRQALTLKKVAFDRENRLFGGQMPNVAFTRSEVTEQLPKWEEVRDCLKGERHVKEKGVKYLPKPQDSGDDADARYKAYKQRAVFYNVTGRTEKGLVGEVFSKDPSIELPSGTEFFEQDVDGAGNTLEQQSKGLVSDILATGRAGLLADFPTLAEGQAVTKADLDAGRIRPRVVPYTAEQIINWRENNVGGETLLTLLVLSESTIVADDGFEFKTEPRWRELRLMNFEDRQASFVQVQVWRRKDKPKDKEDIYEVVEGPFVVLGYNAQPLREIPFTFVGSTNNDSDVDDPPLYDIASLNLAHYRNSADVEESSFLVGQPTLILSGLTQDWVDKNMKSGVAFGSRSAVMLNQGASGDLLQADSNNMPKELMAQKEDQMKALGAKLIEPKKVQSTATEAAIAETSEASVLSSIAKNVSQAYQKALWFASKFLGEFERDKFVFELNTDFNVAMMDAQERAQLIAEWQGELIAWEEAREGLRKAGVAYLDDKKARQMIDAEAAARGGFQETDPNIDPNNPPQ